jgi:hypothetical protein
MLVLKEAPSRVSTKENFEWTRAVTTAEYAETAEEDGALISFAFLRATRYFEIVVVFGKFLSWLKSHPCFSAVSAYSADEALPLIFSVSPCLIVTPSRGCEESKNPQAVAAAAAVEISARLVA